jgi:hypothetical protein
MPTRKYLLAAQGLGRTDDRMVIPSSVMSDQISDRSYGKRDLLGAVPASKLKRNKLAKRRDR